MFGNSNAVKRFGNYRRISAQTDFPAPGVGLVNVAWGFKVYANGDTGSGAFQVQSPVGTNLRTAALTRTHNLGYYFWFPEPVVGPENAVMRVHIATPTGPWIIEFFSAVQPV